MKLNVGFIKSVLNVYDEMSDNGINIVYLGEFHHQITKMFTSMAEDDLDRKDEEKSIIRRVYSVMVETLQNMARHSDEIADKFNIGKGLFMIGKKEDTYFVITSNKVSNSKTKILEAAIKEVNAATRDELKKMYKKQMCDGTISSKGGAGLGLIEIAKRTRNKLVYEFLPLDEHSQFFILKVEINAKKIEG
ncbi:MAG: SiaB family protein kinase [Bacteroidales bacterium]